MSFASNLNVEIPVAFCHCVDKGSQLRVFMNPDKSGHFDDHPDLLDEGIYFLPEFSVS